MSGPQWTRDLLEKTQHALQDLDLRVVRTEAAAIHELEKTSPFAADLVRTAWSRSDKIAMLSLIVSTLISVLTLVLGQMEDEKSKPDQEEIAVIVDEVMKHAEKTVAQK